MPKVSVLNIIFSYLPNKNRISKKGVPANIFQKIEDKVNNHDNDKIDINEIPGNKKGVKIDLKRGKSTKKNDFSLNIDEEEAK